jgi:hypothetical protein
VEPPLNKSSASQTLDLDLGVQAGLFGKTALGFPGTSSSFSRRGGKELKLLMLWLAWLPVLRRGSREAAPGSVLTAALSQSSYKKVDRRPLPPSSSATVRPGRREQVYINLHAKMPFQRPFPSIVEGSQHPTPSGSVPGGVVLVCVASSSSGDGGAGPDCVFSDSLGSYVSIVWTWL